MVANGGRWGETRESLRGGEGGGISGPITPLRTTPDSESD